MNDELDRDNEPATPQGPNILDGLRKAMGKEGGGLREVLATATDRINAIDLVRNAASDAVRAIYAKYKDPETDCVANRLRMALEASRKLTFKQDCDVLLDMCNREVIAAMDELLSDEGSAITIPNANPDFIEGVPCMFITAIGDWTKQKKLRFEGDPLAEVLKKAVQARRKAIG